MKTFLKVRKSQIRNLLGLFRYHKSANFLGVLIRKSQIRNFYMVNPQIANLFAVPVR
jgi:hypothetical protein